MAEDKIKEEDIIQPMKMEMDEEDMKSLSQVALTLPGQKFPTPSPGNGDRVFYESLLEQRPDSEMAQEWCVLYGILDEKRAAQLYALMSKRKGIITTSPVKASKSSSQSSSKSSSNKSTSPKKAPKKAAVKKESKAKATTKKPAAKKKK